MFARLSTAVRFTMLRTSALVATIMLMSAPALASEPEGPVNLLEPHAGLMFWTLIIFIVLMFVLSKYAFKPLFAAVEAREKALEEAIEGAKKDRAEAAELLDKQRAQLEVARTDAQKIIADSRSTAEKMRGELIAETKAQQTEMIEQARRVIEGEKLSAIAQLRRESIDLAIAGASRVIEQNMDSTGNRQIVEKFLASLGGARS